MSSENVVAPSETGNVVATIPSVPTETKFVDLKSSDDEDFQVEEKAAIQSVTIKNIIDDGCGDSVIPIPNVTGAILAKVIEYCKRHMEETDEKKEELKKFDEEFVKVDQATLFDMILAANYLNIKGLLDLTCQTVADMMKGKSPDEIRAKFNITNDFTPEEEAEVRKENAWAFE